MELNINKSKSQDGSAVSSFNYIADKKTKILILGSMPGIKSLKENAYYAHPYNSFWWIIGQLLNRELLELTFEQRYKIIKENNLGLWDVFAQCQRTGSLDSAVNLKTTQLNDFQSFLEKYKSVKTILCNGSLAHQQFYKKVHKPLALTQSLVKLPSTSPAYASITKQQKLEQWQVAFDKVRTLNK